MNRDLEHGMDWLADQFMRIFAADADEIEAPDGMLDESRRAWRMLQFLRQILEADGNPPRTLERYLALEWPMVDFDRILDAAMRNALCVDDECCGRHLSDYTQEEYEDACRIRHRRQAHCALRHQECGRNQPSAIQDSGSGQGRAGLHWCLRG